MNSKFTVCLVVALAMVWLAARAAPADDAVKQVPGTKLADAKAGDDLKALQGKWKLILVYKVNEKKTAWRPEKMDSLLLAIRKRVNPDGRKDISVRALGGNTVEIAMPGVSGRTKEERQAEAEEIRRIIRTTGALEFRIVATKRDDAPLIERARAERKRFPVEPKSPVVVKDPRTGKEQAKWCRVRDQDVEMIKAAWVSEAAMKVGDITVKNADGKDVPKEAWEVLVLSPVSDAYNVTGADIHEARAGTDPETGSPEVLFSFNAAGGVKFGRLTGEHVPIGDFRYKLAIVLDDVLQTAPTIQSIITHSGRITGRFTRQEVEAIAAIINAGSLPAVLEPTPVRETTIEGAAPSDTVPSAGTPSK